MWVARCTRSTRPWASWTIRLIITRSPFAPRTTATSREPSRDTVKWATRRPVTPGTRTPMGESPER